MDELILLIIVIVSFIAISDQSSETKLILVLALSVIVGIYKTYFTKKKNMIGGNPDKQDSMSNPDKQDSINDELYSDPYLDYLIMFEFFIKFYEGKELSLNDKINAAIMLIKSYPIEDIKNSLNRKEKYKMTKFMGTKKIDELKLYINPRPNKYVVKVILSDKNLTLTEKVEDKYSLRWNYVPPGQIIPDTGLYFTTDQIPKNIVSVQMENIKFKTTVSNTSAYTFSRTSSTMLTYGTNILIEEFATSSSLLYGGKRRAQFFPFETNTFLNTYLYDGLTGDPPTGRDTDLVRRDNGEPYRVINFPNKGKLDLLYKINQISSLTLSFGDGFSPVPFPKQVIWLISFTGSEPKFRVSCTGIPIGTRVRFVNLLAQNLADFSDTEENEPINLLVNREEGHVVVATSGYDISFDIDITGYSYINTTRGVRAYLLDYYTDITLSLLCQHDSN